MKLQVCARVMQCMLLLAAWSAAGCRKAEGPVSPASLSYGDLMKPVVSIDGFDAGSPGVRQLHTSYDRKGGNDDFGYYLEKLGPGKYVIADFKGPGCVHRFWYTGIGDACRFSFFLDGGTEPVLKLSSGEITGHAFPFVQPLSEQLSGGTYSYVPIPFNRRLRVILDVDEGARFYYQFAWSKYADGTTLPQFSLTDHAFRKAVEDAAEAWKHDCFGKPLPAQAWAGEIKPGESASLFSDRAGGVLSSFWIKPRFPEGASLRDRSAALRDIVLRIHWDGNRFPSVEAPFGDFFCNAWRERRFSSAPLECTNGIYICRFPMPFRKGVRIELANQGAMSLSFSSGAAVSRDRKKGTPYFHAEWRMSDPGRRPHVILDAKGAGHYVGCFLAVTGTDLSWMILEGDDQIFLNGETAPSMHGTGLEDYFNGGWYYNNLFARPFHGLIERTPCRTAQYRLHVPDPVDFKKSIRVQFEKGSENTAAGFMTSVAYWYQGKPAGIAALPGAALRQSDADPMEFYTLMDALFELERIAHYDEAVTLCDEFCEKYPHRREVGVVRLRKLAYQEQMGGFASVRQGYEQFALSSDPEVAGQAKALLAYGVTPDLALLGVHTMGSYELYLNGKLLGKAKGGPEAMQVFGANMPPGEYVIAAKVPFERHESWFSMYVKSHYTNLYSDISWKFSYEPGDGWEQPGYDDSGWQQSSLKGRIPFLGCDYFVPNAFVGMQSPAHNIRPEGWNDTRRTAFFRKRIVVPLLVEQNNSAGVGTLGASSTAAGEDVADQEQTQE